MISGAVIATWVFRVTCFLFQALSHFHGRANDWISWALYVRSRWMNKAKPLIAGNWKMHCLRVEGEALAKALLKGGPFSKADVLICPPATLMGTIASVVQGSGVAIGAQDCHTETQGAFTGDISASMLKDAGASHVIVGHSERRQHHKETSSLVGKKAAAGHQAGLIALICVGETEAERAKGQTLAVVEAQLKASIPASATASNTVVAYEPVWAIGTGKVATEKDIAEVHGFICKTLSAFPAFKRALPPVLYGGSVKKNNAAAILALECVNGLLVGGASLKADEFLGIIGAAR
jgi:triosephosphate isomerase